MFNSFLVTIIDKPEFRTIERQIKKGFSVSRSKLNPSYHLVRCTFDMIIIDIHFINESALIHI